MKYILFTTAILFTTHPTYCQNEKQEVGGKSNERSGFLATRHWMKKNQVVYLAEDNTRKRVWGKRLNFNLLDESGDTVFLRFKYYDDNTEMKNDNAEYATIVNETNINKDFYLLKKSRNAFKYYYSGLSWGVILAPIKIRPETKFEGEEIPLKLTTNVSIGPYLGYQFGSKRYQSQREHSISSTILIFASPYTSFTEINTSNSKDLEDENGSTVAALSAGIGYLFEISSNFQAGLLYGWDWIGGDLAKKWYYQGKPWFSIAVGFSFRD